MTELREKPSVFAAFSAVVAMNGQRPFLRAPAAATAAYAPSAIEYSYAEAAGVVDELRMAYQAHELKAGDRVAAALDSRLDVYLHMLALNAMGVSMVPMNMGGSDEELRYVISHSDSRLVTGIRAHVDRLRNLFHARDGINFVSAEDLQAQSSTLGSTRGSALGSKPGSTPGTSLADHEGDHATEVALLYTSGTTGRPKGCMLSNYYFLNMGHEYNQLGGLCSIDSNDRLMTPLPPNHMNALSTSFMAMLMCGGCVIQLDRFHPHSWWQTVRSEGATVVHYLGVMPAILLTLETQADEDFSAQVKFGFGAGSDPRHQQAFEERFGFPLIEAWAMTESGGAGMTVANKEPRHLGQRCVGKPVKNMRFRIADAEGKEVPQGSQGELLVRSRGAEPRRGFFSGYYKDATATEEGWAGGWWHTGDIVRQGPDGSLFFVDRQKNVIRRSGENIAAVEVEAAILRHTLVRNCAVTAVPDDIRGDEVFAFVVPVMEEAWGEQLARDIFDHSRQFLTYFKLPAYIAFVNELPLTASQKISRAEVKNRARSMLESNSVTDLRGFKKRS